MLYSLKKDDLDKFQMEFQIFKYDNSLSFLENESKLDTLYKQIRKLDETGISDSTYRTRLLSILPLRFSNLISASNLVKELELTDLIEAIASEDNKLQRCFEEKKVSTNSNSKSLALVFAVYFKCDYPGHKAKDCWSKLKSENVASSNDPSSSNLSETNCNYCKEKVHMVKAYPELKKRRNALPAVICAMRKDIIQRIV